MKIIFHLPLPLNPKSESASGIRPLRMLTAFEELGYEVEVVAGYSLERKKAVKRLKQKITDGVEYDFVYSESSTMPTLLTDKHHFPMNPFLDFDFFRFCNKHNVPVGLFYRDIYWLFDEYYKNVSFLKGSAARLFYYYDLFFYKRLLTKLYLPSLEMGNYIPIVNRSIFSALPPGHSSTYTKNYIIKKVDQAKTLNLLYVGGLSNNYRMHVLFKVLKKFPNIEFTLCTREQEWLDLKEEYPSLSPNIKVVHKSGEDVGVLLLESDIVSLFVEPGEYWSFAAPFKLYEYLGNNKPIIATIGTMSGEFVNENSIGWAIPYKEEALKVLFTQLSESPEMIREAVENMGHVALVNTWRDRAAQVASDLARHL